MPNIIIKNIPLISLTSLFYILISCAGTPPPGHPRAVGFFSTPVFLQSEDGLYISVDKTMDNLLCASSKNKQTADTFYLCDLQNHIISLQCSDDSYIGIDRKKENKLFAGKVNIGTDEKFIRSTKGEKTILKTHDKLCLMIEESPRRELSANDTLPISQKLFKIIPLD